MNVAWRILNYLILAGVALAGGSALSGAAEARRPDIVFILTDDLGWVDVRCFGSR